MTDKLKCKTEECNSSAFTVHIVVDIFGDLAETPRKIEGEYFECCECYNTAEWVSE